VRQRVWRIRHLVSHTPDACGREIFHRRASGSRTPDVYYGERRLGREDSRE